MQVTIKMQVQSMKLFKFQQIKNKNYFIRDFNLLSFYSIAVIAAGVLTYSDALNDFDCRFLSIIYYDTNFLGF